MKPSGRYLSNLVELHNGLLGTSRSISIAIIVWRTDAGGLLIHLTICWTAEGELVEKMETQYE